MTTWCVVPGASKQWSGDSNCSGCHRHWQRETLIAEFLMEHSSPQEILVDQDAPGGLGEPFSCLLNISSIIAGSLYAADQQSMQFLDFLEALSHVCDTLHHCLHYMSTACLGGQGRWRLVSSPAPSVFPSLTWGSPFHTLSV